MISTSNQRLARTVIEWVKQAPPHHYSAWEKLPLRTSILVSTDPSGLQSFLRPWPLDQKLDRILCCVYANSWRSCLSTRIGEHWPHTYNDTFYRNLSQLSAAFSHPPPFAIVLDVLVLFKLYKTFCIKRGYYSSKMILRVPEFLNSFPKLLNGGCPSHLRLGRWIGPWSRTKLGQKGLTVLLKSGFLVWLAVSRWNYIDKKIKPALHLVNFFLNKMFLKA